MPRSEPGLLVMCFYMVDAVGLEPTTFGLKVRHSKPTELSVHVIWSLRSDLNRDQSD